MSTSWLSKGKKVYTLKNHPFGVYNRGDILEILEISPLLDSFKVRNMRDRGVWWFDLSEVGEEYMPVNEEDGKVSCPVMESFQKPEEVKVQHEEFKGSDNLPYDSDWDDPIEYYKLKK